MKRIPCAFRKDADGELVAHAFEWFTEGKGLATRKWDGWPYLISFDNGEPTVYRGIRSPRDEGSDFPPDFLETSDAGSAEVTGWLPIRSGEEFIVDAVFRMVATMRPVEPGSYELCGPDIKDNPEKFTVPTLVNHKLMPYLNCPRDPQGLLYFIAKNKCEGIVWEHDGMRCQVTRKDLGLPWPIQ